MLVSASGNRYRTEYTGLGSTVLWLYKRPHDNRYYMITHEARILYPYFRKECIVNNLENIMNLYEVKIVINTGNKKTMMDMT